MKTKILGAVAGLAALAAVAGTGAGAAEAHGYRFHRHFKPVCGVTWVKVYRKSYHYGPRWKWKRVVTCSPRFYY